MSGYFVTATGTEIGKTYLTCGVIEGLRRRELPVEAIKPVLSGYAPDEAGSSDSGLILKALGRPLDAARLDAITPWRFRAALSPDMAAAREERSVPFDALASFCARAICSKSTSSLKVSWLRR